MRNVRKYIGYSAIGHSKEFISYSLKKSSNITKEPIYTTAWNERILVHDRIKFGVMIPIISAIIEK